MVTRKILKLMEVLNMGEPEEGMLGKGGAKESCATNKAINGCPSMLIKLAQSEFERACVQEFIEVEQKITSIKNDIKLIIKIAKYGLSIATPILIAILIKVLING